MAIEQSVLFTVIPRGVSANSDGLPVSVFVSPRLVGADTLGAFPDWLAWTSRLREIEMTLTIRCDGQTFEAPVDRDVLRPELWEALFHEDTLVRSHQFDDYSERGILSYSVRQTLSALKAIYQEAGVHLALPDTAGDRREESQNRARLRALVSGLDVHWNADRGRSWRDAMRHMNATVRSGLAQQALSGPLDAEGLIQARPDPDAFQQVAVPFAVFHHMPTPSREDHPVVLDADTVLDFHQAVSTLGSYPELLRALGLVFDLELPRDVVPEHPLGECGTLAVTGTSFGWQIPTTTPVLETAYVHAAFGTQRLFFTAPRLLCEPDSSAPTAVLGLLALDPERFGLAQVDVEGGMHKAIILSETLNNPDPDRNLYADAQPAPAPHPEVFDPEATLPALRSGGFTLFADRRGLHLIDTTKRAKAFNDAVESGTSPRPFFAEDLVRGYRLDVWDARTNEWHSLHRRRGIYQVGGELFETEEEEGFVQPAATQPAPGANPPDDDLYVHEAIARWAGWSLSVPRPGKHLSRHADPEMAVPPDDDDPDYREDEPVTPFDMQVDHRVIPGSLPRLAFGRRYRIRARAVDLAGNSLAPGDPLADALSLAFALPRDPEGFAYLRYEPVGAPLLILRDEKGVTSPGSALNRLVIRTFNNDINKDADAADITAADRHIVPPRTSVEMGERLGMFDDATGTLKGDTDTWKLIVERDAGSFKHIEIEIAGKTDTYPIEKDERIDTLPHLPDPLSRGAALRDLPGTPSGTIGRVATGAGMAEPVAYDALNDPNPRPGSATLISFGGSGDWHNTTGFRLALNEPAPEQTDLRPHWNPEERVLTIYLPKGQTAVVPLSSYLNPDDLKLMGVWQWLRQHIEHLTETDPQPPHLRPGEAVDAIAHVLQRAVEGGHWMLTPPVLLTLVHAVQQPLGRPAFTPLNVEHEYVDWDTDPLQTTPTAGRTDPTELAPVTAWRRPGANDAFLTGALKIHGASTAKVDLFATWIDPVDDPAQDTWTTTSRAAHVDELPLPDLREGYLMASGAESRRVGYYDPEHDQVAFVRAGDWTGTPDEGTMVYDKATQRLRFTWYGEPNERSFLFGNAAPRHLLGDTKHHRVRYTAVAASRYQEYFPAGDGLTFTRESEPVVVDVPASARPLAPSIAYVIPTFGWQRQTETNLKRSVRFGGGLRVYLHRPWFSSGEGELLGVALWSYVNGPLTEAARDHYKPFITQWGMDPIWQTGGLGGAPGVSDFPDAASIDNSVSLEERTAAGAQGEPGRIDMAGFPVAFDAERKLWYADLTLDVPTQTYMPFVRLALVRYQPHALDDAKVSRVVLADFAQLTPSRAAMVTADPHHPRAVRVVVSGVAPRGPQAIVNGQPQPAYPTQIRVRVQERNPALPTDLAWHDAAPEVATVRAISDGHVDDRPDLALWSGTVTFAHAPEVNRFRLLIEEYEHISADLVPAGGPVAQQPGRLVYAEVFELDDALIRET